MIIFLSFVPEPFIFWYYVQLNDFRSLTNLNKITLYRRYQKHVYHLSKVFTPCIVLALNKILIYLARLNIKTRLIYLMNKAISADISLKLYTIFIDHDDIKKSYNMQGVEINLQGPKILLHFACNYIKHETFNNI